MADASEKPASPSSHPMTLTTEDVAALVARLRDGLSGVTPGPWQVIVTEHPYILPASDSRPERRGAHVERIVATLKDDPQAKYPVPIVGLSVGVGSEVGDRIHMVRVTDKDAAHIAACSTDNIRALLDHIAAQDAALSTLAGERDEAMTTIGALNHGINKLNGEIDYHAFEEEAWERDIAQARDALAAAEARATTAEAQVAADERRFEQIRTILVNHLNEPERAAFWIAVQGRDAARTALLAGTPPSGAETQEKVDG